jgi:ABC-type uncharacterized transport system substrate-binding protein
VRNLSRWLLILLTLASVHLAQAQQPKKVARIAILTAGTPASLKIRADGFRQGLQELGWLEGQNIHVEYRYTEGDTNKLAKAAAELLNLKVDVIIGTSQLAVRAAMKTSKAVPIVMLGIGSDPVETGLVASLAKPGGNVTGTTSIFQELTGKQLEIFKEAFPKLSRIAVLWNPEALGPAQGFNQLQNAAQTFGIHVQPYEIRKPSDIDKAFAEITKNRLDALLVIADPITNNNRPKVTDLAAMNRLPAMYAERRWAEDGGLMAYGANVVDSARRAATYVDKILKGAKPADLPVEQPTKFEFVINLKTAKQIGLTIPPQVLARADKVIR